MSEPTLKLRVYEGIKQFILSGKLRPGQKLAERDLGKTLKVSRRPIREALGRLVQDGLVENRPQRGHFVREVDANTVEDLYDLREMLKKHAIRLAMRRFSDADLAELDPIEWTHLILGHVSIPNGGFVLESKSTIFRNFRTESWLQSRYAHSIGARVGASLCPAARETLFRSCPASAGNLQGSQGVIGA
jgi:DNA-binding transcriptional regulator YhcF (GntR family)